MKKYIFSLVVAVCFFSSISMPIIAGEILEIPGTGASEVLLRVLAIAFNKANPGDEVKVPTSTGSSGGIRLVGEDKNILGRVARPIKDSEKKYGLTYTVFAKDPVLFAVNKKVGIESLTRLQLREIFSGNVKNWKDVGGRDFRVRLLVREPDDSSLIIIQKHIPAFQQIRFSNHAKTVYHDSEMVDMLQKYSTAIGWLTGSTLNTIAAETVGLSLDGVEPTAENVLGGSYALSCDYAFVYKDDNLSSLAKKFLQFLSSEEAVLILKNQGVIPVISR